MSRQGLKFKGWLVLCGILIWGPSVAVAKKFEGITVNILTFDGPQIGEPTFRRGAEFEKRYGAKIQVTAIGYFELYAALLQDYSKKQPAYDAAVLAPQWMSDFVHLDYLEDITERVHHDELLQWKDIGPFFRTYNASFNNRIYSIPLDGDFLMAYYRSDLLQKAGLKPPQTWDDYLAIAKHFHGKDLNGNGQPDYGSCISKKQNEQAFEIFPAFSSAFIQTKGTPQGAFFDTDNMTPLVNNEAFEAALEIYQQTNQYGPPNEIETTFYDIRRLFIQGRCALSIDWGDVGTWAIDASVSQVINKVGAVILPGSRRVLNRKTGKLEVCTKERCPYAIEGVNHAPFAAFGGWVGSINANSSERVKNAAYEFFSYMSQPAQSNVDVTLGKSGFNPYRISQFRNRKLWLAAGMNRETVDNYLGAIGKSLNNPNMVLDLRIPHNRRYQQIVLDRYLYQLVIGKISTQQAMHLIEAEWNAITDEIGRPQQLKAYLEVLTPKGW